MFGGRIRLVRYSKHFINLRHSRSFCNSNKTPQNLQPNSTNGGNSISKVSEKKELDRFDTFRDLHKLDFARAAKILFSSSHPKKKFGLDFHLVQLFFCLLPSLAVYLLARYSRYRMREVDALRKELELKMKAEEEKEAREMEAAAADEKEAKTNSELLKVKERLEALEETIKEIAVETKKRPSDDKSKNADQGQLRADPNRRSEDRPVSDKNQASNQPPAQPLKQQDIEKKGSLEDKK